MTPVPNSPPTIRIHHLDHGCEVLRVLGQYHPRLLSPLAAASFPGIGWWLAMTRHLHREFPDHTWDSVLDCGPFPGLALAAIRSGVGRISVDCPAAVADKINSIAKQCGSELVEREEVTLDLLSVPLPGGRVREMLEKLCPGHRGTGSQGAGG